MGTIWLIGITAMVAFVVGYCVGYSEAQKGGE